MTEILIGLMGAGGVLLLFLGFLWWGERMARRIRDRDERWRS